MPSIQRQIAWRIDQKSGLGSVYRGCEDATRRQVVPTRPNPDMSRTRLKIMPESELGEGQTHKFKFTRQGKPAECFVARFQGKLVAYVNLCRHIPLSLDYGDNKFFTKDGKSFICETHGALYDPHTGLCTRGPCAGESLHPITVEVQDGIIWAVESP